MGNPKRKRRKHRRRLAKLPILHRRYLLVAASDIEAHPAQEVGKRMQKYILPQQGKFDYAVVVFTDDERIQYLLNLTPQVIVLVLRAQDMVIAANFYKRLEEAKAKHQGYLPDVKVWEVEPPRSNKVPPLHPELSVNFLTGNAVLIDILLRGKRNFLN